MPDAKDDLLRPRPLEILALLPIGVALGILLGVSMKAINGRVSPAYFELISWRYDADVTSLTSIEQGATEGVVSAFAPSFILTVAIGLISKLRCPFQLGFRVQVHVITLLLLFWAIGGCDGVLLASLAPRTFGALAATPKILGIGWVGGSIYGIYFGSILSTIGALFSFARKWRQLEKDAQI